MGMDVAEFGNDLCSCCFRYGSWVAPLITWSGMDPVQSGDKASEEYHKRTLYGAAIEGIGVGASIAPHMRGKGCNAHTIKVSESATGTTETGEFGLKRDELLWSLREWLRTDTGSMLPPDEDLLEEIHTLTYEIKNGKIKVMSTDTIRELLKRSPDRLMSLVMTRAEIKEKANPYIQKPRTIKKYAW
jgi:hypothetical protein